MATLGIERLQVLQSECAAASAQWRWGAALGWARLYLAAAVPSRCV